MIVFLMTGNLGADAVMNKMEGRSIINFSLCHSENWRNKDGDKQIKKLWADCAYNSDSLELLDMLKKGVQVCVHGMPEVRVHVTKSGDPVAVQYLRVSKIEVLSRKKKEEPI